MFRPCMFIFTEAIIFHHYIRQTCYNYITERLNRKKKSLSYNISLCVNFVTKSKKQGMKTHEQIYLELREGEN